MVPQEAGVDTQELIKHVKGRLAAYKAPKSVIVVDSLGGSLAGKLDYSGSREMARLSVDG